VPLLRAGDLVVEADLIVFDKDGVLLDFYRLWEPITAARAAACAPLDRVPALHALLTRILPGASRGEALAAAAAFLAPVRSLAQVHSGFETADLLVDRAAHTHQRSPGFNPGNSYSGRGVDRSFPAIRLNSRNSAVTWAQTAWQPKSASCPSQLPDRVNPVSGSTEQIFKAVPKTFFCPLL
jgi:hypothetical protein